MEDYEPETEVGENIQHIYNLAILNKEYELS